MSRRRRALALAAWATRVTGMTINRGLLGLADKDGDHELAERNIVFAGSNSTVVPTTTPTATPVAPSNGSNTTANNTSPTYSFGIDPPEGGSSGLKYLYLIFLVIGVIVLGLIARIVILKRRRARKLFKADAVRSEALRLDMERNEHLRTSSGSSGQSSGNGSDEWINPPPPYQQPSQPEPIYLGRTRLPVYEEIREEEEEETPSIYHRSPSTPHSTHSTHVTN